MQKPLTKDFILRKHICSNLKRLYAELYTNKFILYGNMEDYEILHGYRRLQLPGFNYETPLASLPFRFAYNPLHC